MGDRTGKHFSREKKIVFELTTTHQTSQLQFAMLRRLFLPALCFGLFGTFHFSAQAQQPSPAPAAAPATATPAASAPPAPASAATTAPNDADDLLAPGPSGATPAPSSADDLLLPEGDKGTNQPMPDDLLLVPNAPQNAPPKTAGAAAAGNAAAAHAQLLVENKFPSASTCATCHPTQFRQWSVSQHAYAQLSPVFNAFQATVDKMTAGTNGDFCIRCHTQVG
ncbi:MAG: multiheme c-type cytochrome, partial [Chthoniobacterales bacterium]